MKCKWCGKEFTPKSYNNVYCSKDCYDEGNRRNGLSDIVYERTCPVCLSKFKTQYKRKVFCCSDCADEYRDIAADILLKRRPLIRNMLLKVKADPSIDIDNLLRKEYPKI